MSDWTLLEAQRLAAQGVDLTNCSGTAALTAGAANTKGAYPATPIVTSTPHDADAVLVTLIQKSAATDYAVDLAIGASGSEVVVVPNLYVGGVNQRGVSYLLPIKIPAGVRLNARCQNPTAAATIRVYATLIQGGMLGIPSFGRCVDLNAVTGAATNGTRIFANEATPGTPAGAGSKRTWAQAVASLAFDVDWLVCIFGDRGLTTRTAGNRFLADIGIGAAAAEQVEVPDLSVGSTSGSLMSHPLSLPVTMRAGERVAVRGAASATTNADMDMWMWGFG